MAMQTITVNGVKISYNSTPKNSVESSIPLADDGLSLMIQATEAYVESGYQIKALEAIGAFSTEAAPELLKKVGNGVKAVIEKIKEFFIKIGQYIKRVFLGAAIKTQAKSTLEKIYKNYREDLDLKTIKVSGCGDIDVALHAMSLVSKGWIDVLKELQNGIREDGLSFEELLEGLNERIEMYNSTISTEPKAASEFINGGVNGICMELKHISEFSGLYSNFNYLYKVSEECVKLCNKLKASDDPDDSTNLKLKQLREIQSVTNSGIKMYSSICKSVIIIGKAISNQKTDTAAAT